ncbi:SseB family protein [Flavobacterium sp. NRK1]|uniref:SseB family protein n=1 Tax=Flavobacterium sp. NRK1 TaxID=2954929 RepID=UPI0020939C45|nr:SseB family protein [Flavobacterium sp. NRK1]MCO6148849.1 SseB family protein [Flavobacterium sp. NRK1]
MSTSKLLDLINIYHEKDRNNDSYKDVILELMNGESLLYIPSPNDGAENNDTQQGETKTLKLSSVFNIDGITVLGAFTDENALFTWAKQPTPYKMLQSKDVLKICEQNAIQRIVINSNQSTMFVLQQD